jgi:hypothetical protein
VQRVLILGDGNLSWSLATLRALRSSLWIRTTDLVITTFDTLEELHSRYPNDPIDEIVNELKKGVPGTRVSVAHHVDATNLGHSLEQVQLRKDKAAVDTADVSTLPHQFDMIIFNFPHWGGRGYIQRNRKLIRTFFESIRDSNVLAPLGQIHLALKEGQGGTPVDMDLGNPGNTWRVVEAGAASNFVLGRVCPFVVPEGYYCSGRRGTQKSFWLGGALNHVFVHADAAKRPPAVPPAGIYPTKFTFDISFWILDENRYQDAHVIAICLGGDDSVRSVKFQDEIIARPRDPLIATSELRSMVFRITYQSNMGPMSRAMMLQRHDALRETVGKTLCPIILVRGSIAFQKEFLVEMGRKN